MLHFDVGFYEWKAPDSKKGGPKQPYLVYAAQEKGRDVLTMSECTAENSYSEEDGWTGPKPLFMAGIFSVWHKPEVGEYAPEQFYCKRQN